MNPPIAAAQRPQAPSQDVSKADAANNPLLKHWATAHGLPPFEAIRPEHFMPAFQAAMQEQREELRSIAQAASAPTFANTVAALDRSGRLLDAIACAFYALSKSATNEALQAVQREVAAPLAAHRNAQYMDQALFARVQAVYEARHRSGLDKAAIRLVERVQLDFLRSGASLPPAARERYGQVMQELAKQYTLFAQNVLHDETSYTLALEGDTALAGLPGFLRDATRQAAADRKLPGHVVTLSRSLIVPFLTYSERADLREQAWRAWVSRGEHAGEHDNRPIVARILALRAEQAALHGHACYADFALLDTMAGSRQAVAKLLDEVWPRAKAACERERQALIKARGGDAAAPIRTWDWRFLAERVRREQFNVDDSEVKPYFPLPAVVQAAFDCASRLFGLSFTAKADIPVYHPDVVAYEVRRKAASGAPAGNASSDASSDAKGELVGIFLQDNFARTIKRSGAWMSPLRWQARNVAGGASLPVIMNNNNFAKAPAGTPTLLSLDDVRTLFHEFGHGLHGLLSDVEYTRLSGTQVLRDFVELPSQLFEHWMGEPQVLKQHARHWQTGQPIPDELIARLQKAQRFGQGYETVRFCASALLDMAAHSRGQDQLLQSPQDLAAFEAEYLADISLPAGVGLNHRLPHFQHLFSSAGYAAGYYVYLWAEVLDADGYGAFKEAGDPFDPYVAARLLRYIYSSGNSLEPGAAFAAFRGRAPRVEPLLHKKGLVPA